MSFDALLGLFRLIGLLLLFSVLFTGIWIHFAVAVVLLIVDEEKSRKAIKLTKITGNTLKTQNE